ncbi:hypothetical protein HWI79_1772 [Cryptosporidium felis]|nr:hypothetical protein HWI79_1772 [Cryptosporidium felis]
MFICSWISILTFFLLHSNRSLADVELQQKNNVYLPRYEFVADELLTQTFPSHKFRDLKRKSRVIMEANSRMLRVTDNAVALSDKILDFFSEPVVGRSIEECFKSVSLIPNNLLSFMIQSIEKILENSPPFNLLNYYSETETIKSYRMASNELLKDYKVIVIRIACRTLITSVLLSSLENLENREHSVKLGLTYPFLDDVTIKPKTDTISNLKMTLNHILDSIRKFGKKIKRGIEKKTNLDNGDHIYSFETRESGSRELISNIYSRRQNLQFSIFGKDKAIFNHNREIVNIINVFLGKQERDSQALIQLFESILRKELGLESFREMKWSHASVGKLFQVCRNQQVREILPKEMKLKTCWQLFNKVGEILTGFHYRRNRNVANKTGRTNILRRIHKASSIKFLQALLIYYNRNDQWLKENLLSVSEGSFNNSHRGKYMDILTADE